MFAVNRIPMEQLKNFENVLPAQTCHVINFSENPLSDYDMITKCPTPEPFQSFERPEKGSDDGELVSLQRIKKFIFETDY